MHILITNDDGIGAPGLKALVGALLEHGRDLELSVVAPEGEQSGAAHAVTVRRPVLVAPVDWPGVTVAYAVDGTPVDCVKLSEALLAEKPDLILSGINRGVNLGTDVLYSGTVGAAIEGALLGCRAIALSVANGPAGPRFATAAACALELIDRLRAERDAPQAGRGVPADLLLNVNVPDRPAEQLAGWRVTRLGVRRYREAYHRREDPRGRQYFWIAGTPDDIDRDPRTDAQALAQGYVSLTPLQFDLTRYSALESLADWERRGRP